MHFHVSFGRKRRAIFEPTNVVTNNMALFLNAIKHISTFTNLYIIFNVNNVRNIFHGVL